MEGIKPIKSYVINLPEDKHLIELLLHQYFNILEDNNPIDFDTDVDDKRLEVIIEEHQESNHDSLHKTQNQDFVGSRSDITPDISVDIPSDTSHITSNVVSTKNKSFIRKAFMNMKNIAQYLLGFAFIGLLLYTTSSYIKTKNNVQEKIVRLELETNRLDSRLNSTLEKVNELEHENANHQRIIDINSKKWIELPDMFHPEYPLVKPKNSYLFAIDEDNQKAYLYKKGWGLVAIALTSTGIGKGQKQRMGDHATPNGLFKVVSVENSSNWFFNNEKAYGPYFFRLDTGSWNKKGYNPKGKSSIGLHGTSHPDLLGSRASRGCLRFYNDFIKWFKNGLDKKSNVYVFIKEKHVKGFDGLKARKDLELQHKKP